MAAGSAAKENAAPPTSDATGTASAVAASASRRHGYGVRSCGVKKRPSKARVPGRVPLRDITNLIEAISAGAGPEASPVAVATELAEPDAVLPAVVRVRLAAALQGEDSAGPAAEPARYSLRKGFR